MFYCASIKQVAIAVMIITLLMFSALLQADSLENADASDSVKAVDAGPGAAVDDRQPVFRFPNWPERPQLNRRVVPPPPPGPYMSSALSDLSVKGLAFGRNSDSDLENNPATESDPSNIPMETFSPDRPWPEHAYKKHKHDCAPDCPVNGSPTRWMPESGYQYVQPRVQKESDPVMQNRVPAPINRPGMNNWPGSRLPSMGGAPVVQYPYAPNYGPRYNAPMN